MNKIDELVSYTYDAQIEHCLSNPPAINESKIPKEFRSFVVRYVENEDVSMGDMIMEYLESSTL